MMIETALIIEANKTHGFILHNRRLYAVHRAALPENFCVSNFISFTRPEKTENEIEFKIENAQTICSPYLVVAPKKNISDETWKEDKENNQEKDRENEDINIEEEIDEGMREVVQMHIFVVTRDLNKYPHHYRVATNGEFTFDCPNTLFSPQVGTITDDKMKTLNLHKGSVYKAVVSLQFNWEEYIEQGAPEEPDDCIIFRANLIDIIEKASMEEQKWQFITPWVDRYLLVTSHFGDTESQENLLGVICAYVKCINANTYAILWNPKYGQVTMNKTVSDCYYFNHVGKTLLFKAQVRYNSFIATTLKPTPDFFKYDYITSAIHKKKFLQPKVPLTLPNRITVQFTIKHPYFKKILFGLSEAQKKELKEFAGKVVNCWIVPHTDPMSWEFIDICKNGEFEEKFNAQELAKAQKMAIFKQKQLLELAAKEG